MTPILAGAIYGIGAWCIGSALLAASFALVRARDNARHRAVRRRMRAALLDQIRIDQQFEAIVATSYARKD